MSTQIELLEEALEMARGYVSQAWWNCDGGVYAHQSIEDDLRLIDAALGRPFEHPNPA